MNQNPNHVYSYNSPQLLPKGSFRRKLLIIVGALFILLVLIVLVSKIFAPKTSADIADSFVSDSVAGNSASAYDLTSPSFRSATSESNFSSNVQYIDSMCKGSTQLAVTKTNTSLAEFVYTNSNTGGGKCHLEVELDHSPKGWQVTFFNEY